MDPAPGTLARAGGNLDGLVALAGQDPGRPGQFGVGMATDHLRRSRRWPACRSVRRRRGSLSVVGPALPPPRYMKSAGPFPARTPACRIGATVRTFRTASPASRRRPSAAAVIECRGRETARRRRDDLGDRRDQREPLAHSGWSSATASAIAPPKEWPATRGRPSFSAFSLWPSPRPARAGAGGGAPPCRIARPGRSTAITRNSLESRPTSA